ncbi:MAG: DUF2341 domain-containing protein [Candidatus Bathyarchaeia archaeon]
MTTEQTKLMVLGIILSLTLLLSINVYGTVYNIFYLNAKITCETPKVILQSGTAGTCTIYTNNTSAKVSVKAPLPVTYDPSWWSVNYNYRRRVAVTNNAASTLSSGYSILLVMDTASLVSSGKMRPDGNDLRVVYWNGTAWAELDRHVIDVNTAFTKIWFMTQADISSENVDNNYYLYYGYPDAINPPSNKSNIYVFYDDFSTDTLSSYQIGRWLSLHGSSGYANPTYDVTNKRVNFDTGDNIVTGFRHGIIGTNLYAEMKVRWENSYPFDTTVGIGMRWTAANSYYVGHVAHGYYTSPAIALNSRTNYLVTPPSNTYFPKDGTWHKLAFAVWGNNLKLWLDDATYLCTTNSAITGSGEVVFEVAQIKGSLDDFLVRRYIEPEPSISLGQECQKGLNNWWNTNYKYRRQVTITAGSAGVPSGYTVSVTLNHTDLVTAGKSLASGNDLRVLHRTGSFWSELDLDIINVNSASTQVWFKTQATISASGSDNNYYIYYGNPSAGSPPANRDNIYVFWDDFESGNLGKWSIQSGIWTVATDQRVSGTYSLKATSGNDAWIKPNVSISEKNVLIESYWRSTSSGLDFAQALRVQPGTSKNWFETNVEGSGGWDIAKMVNDVWSEIIINGGSYSANIWYKVTFIVVGETQAKVLVDDVQVTPASGWANIGTDFTAPGTIALRAWIVGTGAWVDNVKVRKYVNPEPTVNTGTEETTTYDYVLKVKNNQVVDAWKVNLRVYNSLNISRISGAKISFHDGTTSDQIIINGGVIMQSEGPRYDLLGSVTIYISISDLQATASGSSYLYVHLKILTPNTSIYILYTITFEIT